VRATAPVSVERPRLRELIRIDIALSSHLVPSQEESEREALRSEIRLCPPSGASKCLFWLSGGPFWSRLSGALLGPPVSSSSAAYRTALPLTGYRRGISSQLQAHSLWAVTCSVYVYAFGTRLQASPRTGCGSFALLYLPMPSALDCKPTAGHLLCSICLCPRHWTASPLWVSHLLCICLCPLGTRLQDCKPTVGHLLCSICLCPRH
jgi:hypothetical protein